jgi:hypothetical protein
VLGKSVGGAPAAVAFVLLAAGLALAPQRLLADDGIQVPTHAEVVAPVGVAIDIEPGSNLNTINQPCGRDITVAILTTAGFDASTADSTTATFAQAAPTDSAIEDVDGDGSLDLMLRFSCQDVSIPREATQACLQGMTKEGASIEGCDSVRIVSESSLEGGDAPAMPATTPVAAGADFAPPPISDDESTGGWPWLFPLLGGSLALAALVGLASFLRLHHR